MSGPAILKLSSHGARHLAENDYRSPLIVNWTGESNTDSVIERIAEIAQENVQKQLSSVRPYAIPQRLWDYLTEKCDMKREKRWGELGRKGINRIANILTNDTYNIEGKSAFREEFVTCGGVSLSSVNMSTLESKHCPGLYFAGEVLDIDAVTGGFNFQAAWTTAYTVAQNII
jgi:predicted Rossmann fold flavoprotein